MAYRIILFSKLTKGLAVITVPFIDNRGNPRYAIHGSLNSGCNVECDEVYSICRGVVVNLGNLGSTSITVQYSDDTCVTYAHLKSTSVKVNDVVETGTLIGKADKYVLFELIQYQGPSTTWPVRIGAYQYYKQDPEALIAGEQELSDYTAAMYADNVYPQTFDYRMLRPYVVTLTSDSPQVINWTHLKELRVSGAVLYAGQLFDALHIKQPKFQYTKLKKWITDIQEAQLLHGYYFVGRATNVPEAQEEIYELSYIIRNWPATLGVWVMPAFTRTKVTNDLILDTYRDALVELGLTGAIGIYTDKAGLSKFTWADKQADWLLWLVNKCVDVSEFDTALTPDFFRLTP